MQRSRIFSFLIDLFVADYIFLVGTFLIESITNGDENTDFGYRNWGSGLGGVELFW